MNDWKEYEQLAKAIIEDLYRIVESSTSYPLPQRTLLGASGYKHQIDCSLDDGQNLLLVECKCLASDNISLEQVLVFLGRIMDISPLHSGKVIRPYMVTKHGFSRDAKKVAEFYNIRCEIVKSEHQYGVSYLRADGTSYADTVCGMAGFSGGLEETYTPKNSGLLSEND